MGYEVVPRGERYCVVDTDSGRTFGCHDTREAAEGQRRAIGMSSASAHKDAFSDCLARKIPHLRRSGYRQEQAIAIAYSECRNKAVDLGYTVMEWSALSDHQRGWWVEMAEALEAEPGEGVKDALQDCVSRKIPELLRKGCPRRQAIAIAYAQCRNKAVDAGGQVLAWGALSDAQRGWWLEQFEALGEERPDAKSTTIKLLYDDLVGGYGLVWGDPTHTDLDGDYFTPETYFGPQIGVVKRADAARAHLPVAVDIPWYFDHTLQPLPAEALEFDDLRDYEIGTVTTVRADDFGLWIEAQRKRRARWTDAVMDLIRRGQMNWSSGVPAHLMGGKARRTDGWLKAWPIVEWSATPTPAEPRGTLVVQLKHYAGMPRPARPEAAPVEGAAVPPRRTPAQPNGSQEDKDMGLKLKQATAKAVIEAYAQAEHDAIVAAVADAVKQEGDTSNMVAEALTPLAEQLAELAGTSADDALAVLVQYVAEHVAGGAEPEMEEPEAPPAPAMSVPETLSVDPAVLEQAVAVQVAKALQALLPTEPGGAHKTNAKKAVNVIGIAERPLTLGSWIKAIRDKDHTYLHKHHPVIKASHKALGISPDTAGGYLVPVEQSSQIIELLRAAATVLPLCRRWPMNSATATIPSQTGGATAYWVAENTNITASQETFGQKLLVAKKLAVLVQIGNELLEDSDPEVDAIIREDIATVAALKVDEAILRGSGVGAVPLGILYAGATTTALNAALTYKALSQCVNRVEEENVIKAPPWAWVIRPRDKDTLRRLEDTAGNLIFAGPGASQQAIAGQPGNTLLDYPVHDTTTVDLDTDNNDETRVYFGQWNDVVVGQRKSLEIMASGEAGTSFQADQTWIRAILRMDVVLRHVESIEVLTDVRAAS